MACSSSFLSLQLASKRDEKEEGMETKQEGEQSINHVGKGVKGKKGIY
jgi:hypothetical protein